MDHWLLLILLPPPFTLSLQSNALPWNYTHGYGWIPTVFVEALIISCWDYCSSLLTCLPALSLCFLQSILILWCNDHSETQIFSLFQSLHWLLLFTGWNPSILCVPRPACLFSPISCSFYVFLSFLAMLNDLYFPECTVLFHVPAFVHIAFLWEMSSLTFFLFFWVTVFHLISCKEPDFP